MSTVELQRYRRSRLLDAIACARRPLHRRAALLICISLLPLSCAQSGRVAPPGTELPELIWNPPLAYPPVLSRVGITGTVVLEGVVDTAGRVEPGSVRVIRSTRASFEPAAIEMLRHSRFRPARSLAGPVRMRVRVPVRFALDRVSRADSLVAAVRVLAAERLARAGQIPDAIAEYGRAQAVDPRLATSPRFWYGLCWYGSVWGRAREVMVACDQAVELAVNRGSMNQGRAIARILTGDLSGAIEDLEAFLGWTRNERDQVQGANWIQQLRAGRNPLTPEVLQSLRER